MVDNVNQLNALPVGDTANNIPTHVQLLKDDINSGSLIRRLTTAVISALTFPQKPAGVVVYDTTRNALQQSDGTSFGDIMPLGAIIAYGGTSAPPGWALCNGSAHGSAGLLTLLGSANTPDLRDRFIVGVSGSKPRGTTGGAETVTLTAAQSGLPAHSHGIAIDRGGSDPGLGGSGGYLWNDRGVTGLTSNNSAPQSASASHENMPPYYALVYIIKAF